MAYDEIEIVSRRADNMSRIETVLAEHHEPKSDSFRGYS